MSVLVVGGGLVGLSLAWRLLLQGQDVNLIDPALEQAKPTDCGSAAALGLLMAQVFHRSSGRGWRLRQRSQALWPQWLAQLEARGHHLPRRQGLLLLAATAAEWEHQQRLAAERQRRGIPLECWQPAQLAACQPQLPAAALGGLWSPQDGQLDPGPLLRALWQESRAAGLRASRDRAVAIRRQGRDWQVQGASGERYGARWLVISAGVASGALLAGLGHQLPMEPVLGQALELELAPAPGEPSACRWQQGARPWPGAVAWRGLNLVPRPDLAGGRRLWLGATLEPGDQAAAAALADLRHWGDAQLPWLAEARVVRHWQGLRCRPVGRPAPVLEQLEPGLLVVSGHYRNGVLLAPASAEWACEQILAKHEKAPLAGG